MERKVNYEDVARTAVSLLVQGINPSVAKIRQALGGIGSPNTINDHLREWREELAKRETKMLPPAVPDALVGAVGQFWEAARLAAEQALIPELRRAADEVEAANAKERAAERGLEESKARLTEAQEQLASSGNRIESLSRAAEREAEHVRQLEAELDRVKHDAENRVAEASRRRDAAIAETAQERHSREDERSALQGRIQFEQERAERQEAHWLRQVDSARTAERKMKEEVERLREQLKDERRDREIEHTALKAAAAEQAETLAGVRGEARQLTIELEQVRAQAFDSERLRVAAIERAAVAEGAVAELKSHEAELLARLESAENELRLVRQPTAGRRKRGAR